MKTDTADGPPELPVLAYRERILAALGERGAVVLRAPTGSGKSTQLPRFLLESIAPDAGRILVLQPRRIAAMGLAWRVAEEIGQPVGESVGYQVRFESRFGPFTRVLFQTYGTFFQGLKSDPRLNGVAAVVFDEFHERTLESDAGLAWVKRLRKTLRPDLWVVVMSATMQMDRLLTYLNASEVEVPGRLHPVEISHQAPNQGEQVWDQAARAFRTLVAGGLHGSTLIFMPGVYEIRRTVEALGDFCSRQGWSLSELHGSLPPEVQRQALKPLAAGERRLVVATNVAETSLTLPGIEAVIDTGLARLASFDPDRQMNTLYLGRISRQSAQQRAGRAGRTGPGKCIRLWAQQVEQVMVESLPPEIHRLELAQTALSVRILLDRAAEKGANSERGSKHDFERNSERNFENYLVEWLDQPLEAHWVGAETSLRLIGAIDAAGALTDTGRSLDAFPLHPRLARALREAEAAGLGALGAAMAAIMEAPPGRERRNRADLYLEGRDLMERSEASHWPFELKRSYQQILGQLESRGRRVSRDTSLAQGTDAMRRDITRCWLVGFRDRLASRGEGKATYQLADGRKGTLVLPDTSTNPPPSVLALELHEVGGSARSRLATIPMWLPVDLEWLREWLPDQCRWESVAIWDESRRKMIREEQLVLDGLVMLRRQVAESGVADLDSAALEEFLVEKLATGEETLPGDHRELEQLTRRIRLVARVFPQYGLPLLEEEDWRLIYHELVAGRTGLDGLETHDLEHAVSSYLSPMQMSLVEKEAPREVKLATGRKGKVEYFDEAPPELSARIGDFVGMEGRFTLCSGRVQGLYQILAPNRRPVQKTADLTGFWQNTYPEVKKELKRRYPKHPWP